MEYSAVIRMLFDKYGKQPRWLNDIWFGTHKFGEKKYLAQKKDWFYYFWDKFCVVQAGLKLSV